MPDRAQLVAALEAEGLRVTEWTDPPGASYPEHAHPSHEVRIVLAGAMTVVTALGATELGPGDRIDLPPGVRHSAVVGPAGVRFLAGTRV